MNLKLTLALTLLLFITKSFADAPIADDLQIVTIQAPPATMRLNQVAIWEYEVINNGADTVIFAQSGANMDNQQQQWPEGPFCGQSIPNQPNDFFPVYLKHGEVCIISGSAVIRSIPDQGTSYDGTYLAISLRGLSLKQHIHIDLAS